MYPEAILLILFFLVEVSSQCFQSILKLSEYDRQLGENTLDATKSRLEQKLGIAKYYHDPTAYAKAASFLKSKGNGFSCGYTSSWIGEILNGLKSQHFMFKNGAAGDGFSPNTAAGYEELIGEDLVNYVKTMGEKNNAMNFYFYHGGNADHVWHVEQLANRRGYRIYQSYNSVYSLAAWLEPNYESFKKMWSDNPLQGHIVPNWKLYYTINQFIKASSGGLFNITTYPPNVFPPDETRYINFWKNYSVNKTRIMEDLWRSKVKYGNGRIIPQSEFYDDYLVKLGTLTQWYKVNGQLSTGLSTIVPDSIFNIWTDIYASPNPQIVAGSKYGTIVKVTSPGKNYFFQLQGHELQRSECKKNFEIILKSLN